MCGGIDIPVWRNGVGFCVPIKGFSVSIFWVVVDEERRVPRAIENARTSVKAFGGFVEE